MRQGHKNDMISGTRCAVRDYDYSAFERFAQATVVVVGVRSFASICVCVMVLNGRVCVMVLNGRI